MNLFLFVEWMAAHIDCDRLTVPKSHLTRWEWSAIAGGHNFTVKFTDKEMMMTADDDTEVYRYRLDGQTLTASTASGQVTMEVYMADVETPNLVIDGIIFHKAVTPPEIHKKFTDCSEP